MDQDQNLKPRVSICIATYNRASFIVQAIESVLTQSYPDWELIIIDDASTDDTAGLIRPFLSDLRFRYFANDTNRNISYTRNRALDLARGEYVAILDSDDYWTDPEKIAKQIDFLDRNPDYILVGTQAESVDPAGRRLRALSLPQSDHAIRGSILRRNPIIHSTVIYRRDQALAAGKYNLALNGIEDYDLWLRLGRIGKMANLPDQTTAYRVHPGNIVRSDRLRLMTINLDLVENNRKSYPGYLRARWRRYLRLAAFRLLLTVFRFLPRKK